MKTLGLLVPILAYLVYRFVEQRNIMLQAPGQNFRSIQLLSENSCNLDCLKTIQRDMEILDNYQGQFWIDSRSEAAKRENYKTSIERLAYDIYNLHCGEIKGCGGEWWIQVRDDEIIEQSVPLHWDKDERYMQERSVINTPYITSVTYLNDGAFPTFALDVQVDSDGFMRPKRGAVGETIHKGLLGIPRFGRHIVFDGTVLHGALMHKDMMIDLSEQKKRYVFVMSFWLDNYRPLKAIDFPEKFRVRLSNSELKNALRVTSERIDEQKNIVHISPNQSDQLYTDGSFKDYTFHWSHLQMNQVHKMITLACLPKPDFIKKMGYRSFEIIYGQKCKADVESTEVAYTSDNDWIGGELRAKAQPLKFTPGIGSVLKQEDTWSGYIARRAKFYFKFAVKSLMKVSKSLTTSVETSKQRILDRMKGVMRDL